MTARLRVAALPTRHPRLRQQDDVVNRHTAPLALMRTIMTTVTITATTTSTNPLPSTSGFVPGFAFMVFWPLAPAPISLFTTYSG